MKTSVFGGLMIVAAVVLQSLAGLIIRSVPVGIIWMIFIRCLSAGIFLSPFLIRRRVAPVKTAVFTGVSFFFFICCFMLTTRLGTAALGISMQYTSLVFILGWQMFKAGRPTTWKLAVIGLILAGVAVNAVNAMATAAPVTIVTGLLIGFLSVLYGTGMKNIKTGNALGIASAMNLVSAMCCVPFLPFQTEPMPTDPQILLVLVLSGVLVSGMSYVFYGMGVRRLKLENVVVITLLEPILNPLWVFLGRGEVPPLLNMIGLFIIVGGAFVEVMCERRENKLAATEQNVACDAKSKESYQP